MANEAYLIRIESDSALADTEVTTIDEVLDFLLLYADYFTNLYDEDSKKLLKERKFYELGKKYEKGVFEEETDTLKRRFYNILDEIKNASCIADCKESLDKLTQLLKDSGRDKWFYMEDLDAKPLEEDELEKTPNFLKEENKKWIIENYTPDGINYTASDDAPEVIKREVEAWSNRF